MTKVYRNDIYVRSEHGGSWFNEFLHRLAGTDPSSVQEILNAINNKRTDTVDSVVQSYREKVGLDSLSSIEENDTEVKIKNASYDFKPLSIRHASENKSIVQMIEDDANIKAQIDSHCEHSGGTKSIESLIDFLRNILGHEVKFSDKELVNYLEERKNKFRHNIPEISHTDVGRVGVDPNEQYDDDQADYIKYDGAK